VLLCSRATWHVVLCWWYYHRVLMSLEQPSSQLMSHVLGAERAQELPALSSRAVTHANSSFAGTVLQHRLKAQDRCGNRHHRSAGMHRHCHTASLLLAKKVALSHTLRGSHQKNCSVPGIACDNTAQVASQLLRHATAVRRLQCSNTTSQQDAANRLGMAHMHATDMGALTPSYLCYIVFD
jgi:hypothetical protein